MVNRIIDYPATTTLSATDAMVVDSQAAGTQKLEAGEALWTLIDSAGAPGEIRNGFFRGKNLGSKMTDAQYASVQNGSFKGLFLGDYWTSGSETWRIAGFNYWSGAGQTIDAISKKPHIAIFPDRLVGGNAIERLHNGDSTTVGYANYSYIANGTLDSFMNSKTSSVFANRYLSLNLILATSSSAAGEDQTYEKKAVRYVLPSSFEVCGILTRRTILQTAGVLPLVTIANRYSRSSTGGNYFCREALNGTSQCTVGSFGGPTSVGIASASKAGIRPLFAIG